MPAYPLVFVDVDTQRDFLDPGGALPIAGASAILPNLARLTEFARKVGIPVLATACAHAPDDPDPEPFPLHCLIGTAGRERVAATSWPGSLVVGPDDRLPPGDLPPHVTLEKRHYDVFSHPEADRLVSRYDAADPRRPTFVVYGVATDYCVGAAVRGLLVRGHRVVLVADAIRPVDRGAEAGVLTELVGRGASLILTAGILAAARHSFANPNGFLTGRASRGSLDRRC